MKRFLICLGQGLSEMDFSPYFHRLAFFANLFGLYDPSIEKHGLKGVLMGIARILRCHPLSETGDDPVPDYFSLKRNKTPLDK